MKLTTLTSALVLATTMSIASLGIADEEKNITVFVKKGASDQTRVDLTQDGNASTFVMPDLKDGESETIVTESGKQFIVTRNGDGYTLLTEEGKTIDLGFSASNQLATKFYAFKDGKHLAKDDGSITVSGGDLSEEQKLIIKDAFVAAGIDADKVKFTKKFNFFFDSKSADNIHIEVIREEIDGKEVKEEVKKIILKNKDEN